MKVRCTSDKRELILRILQQETEAAPTYAPLPDFAFEVGGYRLRRDGWLETALDVPSAFNVLASLGLCDFPLESPPPDERDFVYPMYGQSGGTLLNLLCILSARQHLLNRALETQGGFALSPQLMRDLLSHPPESVPAFLQALYGREEEHRGVDFTLGRIAVTGFRRGRREEVEIHRLLSDSILHAAMTRRWAKAFTPRVRNQKYAFRIWLNTIGLTGEEYSAARAVMLARLPGRSDRRPLQRTKEG